MLQKPNPSHFMNCKSIVILSIALLSVGATWAQDTRDNVNPHSVRPVQKEDIMFKKSLWFQMDLRTKQNAPLYVPNNELPKLLIDAVKNKKIVPYANDSLATRLTYAQFLERIRIPQSQREDDMFASTAEDDGWGNSEEGKKAAEQRRNALKDQEEYFPHQMFRVEIKEDLIFDRRRSRMLHDIQSITIVIPSEITPTGLDIPLCSFSYKELYDKVFHVEKDGRKVDNPETVWFNPQNSAAHLNLGDAFDLRLFEARLVKYENPKNSMIVEMYDNNKRALIHSEQALYQLMEYEALLWSY